LAPSLPAKANPEGVRQFRQRLDDLRSMLARAFANDTRPDLAAVDQELGALSDLLTQVYFNHVVPRLS
jgi:hypothetical protein